MNAATNIESGVIITTTIAMKKFIAIINARVQTIIIIPEKSCVMP